MANVGYATLSITPSLRGLQRSMQQQLGGVMPAAGRRAGRDLGAGINAGTQRGIGRMSGPMGAITAAAGAAAGRVRESFGSAFSSSGRAASGLGGQIKGLAGMGTALAAGLGFVNITSQIYDTATGAQHTEAVLGGLYDTAGHGAGMAGEMMDLLNDRFARSSIEMTAFQQGASDLAYLGLTAEETADVLGFMESTIVATGGSASELGRVTQALASAQNAGRASAAELNQISQAGVPIYDMLADHLGITNAEIRDLTGSGELLVEDVLEAMQAQGGTWAQGLIDGAENASATWSSSWAQMKNTFVNGISLELMPLLDRLAPTMTGAADAVGDAFEALPGVVSRVAQELRDAGVLDALQSIGESAMDLVEGVWPALQGFATGLGVAFSGIVLALEPVFNLLGQLGEWMQANEETVKAFGVALGVLVGLFLALKGALAIGGAIAALANPVGLVIAAIAALVAGIVYAWKNSERFRDVVTAAWEWIKDAAQTTVDWFMETAWPKIQEFWDLLVDTVGDTGFWSDTWEQIKDVFQTVWDFIVDIWDEYGDYIMGAIQLLAGYVSSVWSGLWTALPGVLSGVWTIITSVISGALDIIIGLIDFFAALFTGDWQGMWDAIGTIGEGMWTIIVGLFEGAIDIIWGLLQGLWEIIVGIWETIYDVLVGNSIIPDLVEAITGWFEALAGWISGILTGIWDFIVGIWNTIADTVAGVVEGIVSTVQAEWDRVRTGTRVIFDNVRTIIQNAWNMIRARVSAALNNIRDTVTGAWSNLRDRTTTMWNALRAAVVDRINNMMRTVRDIPNRIRSAFANAGQWLRTAGGNLITGLINGITGRASDLYDRLRNIASNALDAARSALGISSPSRYFRDQVGAEVIAGLLQGLERGQVDVDAAVRDLVDTHPTPATPRITPSRSHDQAAEAQTVLLSRILRALDRDQGDVVLRVDSQEIARATARGQRQLARR